MGLAEKNLVRRQVGVFLDRTDALLVRYNVTRWLTAPFIVLILPCYLALINLPFGYWDYFGYLNWYLGRPPAGLADLVEVLRSSYEDIPIFFRPSHGLYFELLAVAFRGDSWLYYVVKWSIRLAAICLIYQQVKRISGNRELALASWAFFMFHPAVFEPMLFSADGLMASLMVLATSSLLSG